MAKVKTIKMNELRERMLNTSGSIRAFEEAEQEMIIAEQSYNQ